MKRLKSLAIILLFTTVGSFAHACLDFNGTKICAGQVVYTKEINIYGATLLAVNPHNNMATIQARSNDRTLSVSIKDIAYPLPSMGSVKLGSIVHHPDLNGYGAQVLGFNPFNGLIAVRVVSNDKLKFYPPCELGLTDVCLYFQTSR